MHKVEGTQDLPWLDWLRFISAFVVVLGHIRGATFVAWGDLPSDNHTEVNFALFLLTRIGTDAVTMFFVLSGYLVGGRIVQRVRNGTFNLTVYAVDRLTRIYLPLIPAIMVTVVVSLFLGLPVSLITTLGNLLSLQGIVVPSLPANGPLWSLSHEVWFYVFGGAMAILALRENFLALLFVMLSCMAFTANGAYFFLPWLIGACCYVWQPKQRRFCFLILGSVLLAVGSAIRQFSVDGVLQLQSSMLSAPIGTILVASGAGLVVTQLVLTPAPRSSFSGKIYRVGHILAGFSYTMYLTHAPLLEIVKSLLERRPRVDAIGLVVMLGIAIGLMVAAYLIYLPFERNTARVRRSVMQALQKISRSGSVHP